MQVAWSSSEVSQLRAMLDSVSDLVLAVSHDGTISWASPSVSAWVGRDPDTVIGHSVAEFIDLDRHPAWRGALEHMARHGGRFGPFATELPLANGRRRAAQVVITAYASDEAGNAADGAPLHGLTITVRDPVDVHTSVDELARSEARFRALVDGVSEVIVVLSWEARVRYASPAAQELMGVRLDQPGIDVLSFVHPDDVEAAIEGLERLRAGRGERSGSGPTWRETVVVRVAATDGSWRTMEVLGRNLMDNPEIAGLLITARDITEIRRREEQVLDGALLLERLAQGASMPETLADLIANQRKWVPDGVPVVALREPDGVIRATPGHDLPDELELLLDSIGRDSPLGRAARAERQPAVFTDIAADPLWEQIGPAFAAHGLVACWMWVLLADDGAELGTFSVFLSERRRPTAAEQVQFSQTAHLAAIIIQRHLVERALAHQALHDTLTGLPNRNLLVDHIDEALALSQRNGDAAAVLFCDLDRFKVVNDSLGHASGDRLLRLVVERWQQLLRQGDTIGRFGGDEFIVVANAIDRPRGADALAKRLIRALDKPFLLDGVEVVVGVSVGVALAPAGSGEAEQLIRDADAAMYEAKNRGRGGFVVFERPMHDEVVERLQLEADLRRAVPGEELVVHYQTLVRVEDRAVAGLEALVRWNRPGRGLVMPAEFVDVAEETGLIVPLGSWVLREVVRQAAAWSQDPLLADLRITTNLSARQLVEPGLVDEVRALTAEFGVDPARLWLEVTESVLADDPGAVARVIDDLFDAGVRVAIDDFGSGYTSLEYAQRFAVLAGLKIDQKFVVDLDDPASHSEAIVASLVVLGRGLDALVVAEGVETESQFEVLQRLGCDMVQGYLFGRPVAGSEVRERILALQAAGSPTFIPDPMLVEARLRR